MDAFAASAKAERRRQKTEGGALERCCFLLTCGRSHVQRTSKGRASIRRSEGREQTRRQGTVTDGHELGYGRETNGSGQMGLRPHGRAGAAAVSWTEAAKQELRLPD